MPYISQTARKPLDNDVDRLAYQLGEISAESVGKFNYAITRLLNIALGPVMIYSKVALVSGLLSNLESEFYRRLVGPFEDKKQELHGDVYDQR